jgi:predicted HAD superfamily phosphohydrolase YqeG
VSFESPSLASLKPAPYNGPYPPPVPTMNVFFDCDYTIIAWNGKLRPGVRETFQRLKEDGHTVFVWSGMGIRWGEVRSNGLESYVTACFHKPLYNFRSRLEGMGVTPVPDVIVDDYLEIVQALGGIRVRPYVYEDAADSEMEKVYQILSSFSMDGHHNGSYAEPLSPEPW